MSQQLDRQTLADILQAEDIEGLSFLELVRLFQEEKGISKSLPDGVYQIDPRNGERIIYHSSRARRPHDNRPSLSSNLELEQECVICQGHTTGIIDVADLSQGFTFINKNLFPILYPLDIKRSNRLVSGGVQAPVSEGCPSYGFHFLQWTSSQHDRDWHNMPLSDNVVVMKRLAALEKKLLTASGGFMPATETWGDCPGRYGFVLIIKNYGHLVGGSLSHGHQQIAFSNVMPRRIWDNWRFEREKGELFAAYLLRETPPELIIRDYGPATLLVPYFMRRPFDMMLLLKDTSKKYIYELTEAEIAAVAEGWHDAIRAIRLIMPEIGREIAYNVTTHNGPGAGLYFEFLPYTQEIGGVEHLGLFVCQGSPKSASVRVRELLHSTSKRGDRVEV